MEEIKESETRLYFWNKEKARILKCDYSDNRYADLSYEDLTYDFYFTHLRLVTANPLKIKHIGPYTQSRFKKE